MCSKGEKMYYNRYDDNCEDKKYSSREKEKCCVRVTEYCCYPSYYTEEKNDKYEDKKHDCGCKNDYDYKKDCDCKKEPICREERKEKRTNRCCCPLFRHWCW